MNYAEAKALIPKLTPAQLGVLGQIALDNDGGHHPKTIASLERLRLIESEEEILGGRFPVRIKRYSVSTPVHIAWCEWCSEIEQP